MFARVQLRDTLCRVFTLTMMWGQLLPLNCLRFRLSFSHQTGRVPWGRHVTFVVSVRGRSCNTAGIIYRRWLRRYGDSTISAFHQSAAISEIEILISSVEYWYFSRVSVAKCLKCGEIFNYHFIANLLLSITVRELWKAININEVMKHGGLLFVDHPVCV